MNIEYRFLRPVDVLYLRGNRLFGEAGEHAEACMPPWPSLFAGALRSRMLADHGAAFDRFADGKAPHPVLGTPEKPGSFRLAEVALARCCERGVERYFPLPADLFVFKASNGNGGLEAHILQPLSCSDLRPVSTSLADENTHLAVLKSSHLNKPAANLWLRECGFLKYLRGSAPDARDLVTQESLWNTDSRLGIALDLQRRSAARGRIYTTDAVALHPGVGFLVGVRGADGHLPSSGLIRLGGDGRAASIEAAAADRFETLMPAGPRFRMILATPGLFPAGWLPPRVCTNETGEKILVMDGLKARLVAACIPRYQVVSGWDIARNKPKPAERAVPAGSVYWFELLEGSTGALHQLVEDGLWPLIQTTDDQRRAEGFNNVWFGDWK